jgi:hypothetical protein
MAAPVMTVLKAVLLMFTCVLSAVSGYAADAVSGVVHNQTTGKPAAGDDVILLRLAQGMQEEARTTTDAQGAFTFNIPATQVKNQRLVRVMHQGVNYDQVVVDATPLQPIVFDAVPKVTGLKGSIGVVRVESEGTTLKMAEMYSITNASAPPVTQAGPRNFQISTPANAVFDFVQAKGPGGIWVNVQPKKAQAGRYNVDFPIRPGETLFKFAYHLPYAGQTALRLKLAYPIERFAVMHPQSMSFKPLRNGTFTANDGPNGLVIEAAVAQPSAGDVPAFEISGGGALPPITAEARNAPPRRSAPAAATNPPVSRPAVPPNAAPDLSARTFWFTLLGIAVIAVAGGLVLWRFWRKRGGTVEASAGRQPLLEALKEELFHLEKDRVRGTISEKEYADTKEALKVSLQRAMAKSVAHGPATKSEKL